MYRYGLYTKREITLLVDYALCHLSYVLMLHLFVPYKITLCTHVEVDSGDIFRVHG